MPEEATKPNKRSPEILSPRQMHAASLLALGQPVNEVAEAVGINRHQIWEYKQNPYFVAQINQFQAEMWANTKTRLRGLLSKAVRTLEEAVENGDVKASIEILRVVGLHGRVGAPTGPTTAEAVMIEEAKWFTQKLLSEPSKDLLAQASYAQRMTPVLVSEKYHEIKNKLENLQGEDDDDTTNGTE